MSESAKRRSVLYRCPSCGAWPFTWRPGCEACVEANARAPEGMHVASLRMRELETIAPSRLVMIETEEVPDGE